MADESGRFTCTSTGWNERLDCGMLTSPVGLTVAEAEPVVDIPAIVNEGVNTDRCIETLTSPAFAMLRARARRQHRSHHGHRERDDRSYGQSSLSRTSPVPLFAFCPPQIGQSRTKPTLRQGLSNYWRTG